MVTMRSIATATAAAALILGAPVSAANAASRPGSAVPAASAVGVAGMQSTGVPARGAFASWPAYLAIGFVLAFGVWIAAQDDDDGELPLPVSRG